MGGVSGGAFCRVQIVTSLTLSDGVLRAVGINIILGITSGVGHGVAALRHVRRFLLLRIVRASVAGRLGLLGIVVGKVRPWHRVP